ncbi:MAG: hypothetical protein LAN84_00650 [Acidobacteriia bacterium]|nr:hypothetical protein [Terriglobia bacterium]
MTERPAQDHDTTPAEAGAQPEDRAAHRVRLLSWCAAVFVAAFLTWSARFSMNPDGISYLDIADSYLHGRWSAALNAYWSPLYSWVLALDLGILKPSAFWEFPAIQLINFAVFLIALAAFDRFWRAQGERYIHAASAPSDTPSETFPRWAWLALGYALFIWTIANATVVSQITPDLLVAALVYMIAAILVRIRAGNANIGLFFFFGFVLGLGYLGKTVMFLLGFVFLGVSFLALRDRRKAVTRLLAALLAFLLVTTPFIFLISRSKGRFTFGESGRLGYAWVVNRSAPFFNWQGADPAGGVPRHTTRKIHSAPALYEYASPVSGTYPPHYDPSYWNDGLTPHFHFQQQLRVIMTSIYASYDALFLPQSGLIACALILILLSGSSFVRRFGENWHLWIPAAAGFGLYALVTVEPRYVAGLLLMLWAALLSAIRLPRSEQSKKLLAGVTIVAVLLLSLSVAEKMAIRIYEWKDRSVNLSWQIADGLRHFGLQQGDKVASLGAGYNNHWARTARLKIVAEIPSSDVGTFWAAGPQIQSDVYAICARIGVRAIVANEVPRATSASAWQPIGNTGYYVYLLPPPTAARPN